MTEFLNKIMKFADAFKMLPDSGVVLVCVSGGADSMCLLEALLEISSMRGFTLNVAHYNHMLRGEESERDEAFVREYCMVRNIPFYCDSGDVKAYAKIQGVGIEEAARNMRYGFFYNTAVKIGATRIATAHTADDNAETIIMNLARGAGANGLSGIPPKRDVLYTDGRNESELGGCFISSVAGTSEYDLAIIRPMLQVSKDDVLSFLSNRGITFVQDSTNNLDAFTRNKIRHIVMPVIKEINPRFNEAATAVAEISRADEEYLSTIADRFINAKCSHQPLATSHCGLQGNIPSLLGCEPQPTLDVSADIGELLGLPFAVSGRVIRKLCGGNLSLRHVKAVLELCRQEDPSACLSLPRMTVYREYGRVVFGSNIKKIKDSFEPIYPRDGECIKIPIIELKMSCKTVVYSDTINKSFTSFLFKYVDLCGRMTVRSRREGDFIRLYGQNCTKTLKKLFIERRIPIGKRELIPVLADEDGVLAVYGIGMGDRAVPEPGDLAFQISFEEI